jgi:hypothetical protein
MANHPRIYPFIACVGLLAGSMTSAVAESDAWLVSVECGKFQRVGDTVRVNEDTLVVDTDWDGYSLSAGREIAQASTTARDKKLFRLIVEACKL